MRKLLNDILDWLERWRNRDGYVDRSVLDRLAVCVERDVEQVVLPLPREDVEAAGKKSSTKYTKPLGEE